MLHVYKIWAYSDCPAWLPVTPMVSMTICVQLKETVDDVLIKYHTKIYFDGRNTAA